MEVLCSSCKYAKLYCTANRENVKGIFSFKMEELDLPDTELYSFYRCLIRNEPVKNPCQCEYYSSTS